MSGQESSAQPSSAEPSTGSASAIVLPALGHAVVLLALLAPQLGLLASHLPSTPNSNDAQLIVWILSWVEHALRDASATLFDANINFPAPNQLTGSDYFLSSQLLFAPLLWLTGNAVLAVNLTALATYWLAAFCCDRLLRVLGCPGPVAFVGGLGFALSRLQIPFNVHVLQYPIFLFPLLALALLRLRERADVRHMLAVAAVFALGTFASLYAAILTGVVGFVWALRELAYARGRRVRFVALGSAAVVLAVLPLVPVLGAYLLRAGTQGMEDPEPGNSPLLMMLLDPAAALVTWRLIPVDVALGVLSLVAIVALLLRDPVARRVVPVALALVVVGDFLTGGVPPALVGTVVADVFRFMRYTHRFSAVATCGASLLLAAALAALWRWLPRLPARLVVLVVLLAIVLDKGAVLRGGGPLEVAALGRDRAAHRAIGALAMEHGRGPLLVLPSTGSLLEPQGRPKSLEPDTMLASTLHWLPLVNGYTGHQPAHRMLLLRLIAALPESGALDDLIDLTHLRWIALRPESTWPEPQQRARMEVALRASPAIAQAWDVAGWSLLEVGRTPQHASWFEAVTRGTDATTTVLGTSLDPLPAGADVGVLEFAAPPPVALPPKLPFWTSVALRNAGTATWPTMPAPVPGLILDLAVPGEMPRSGSVLLVARWRPLDGPAEDEERHESRLRRDVAPGEALAQKVLLVTPEKPGRYRVELSLEQIDGARFDGPGNVRARHDVTVRPAAPATAAGPATVAP